MNTFKKNDELVSYDYYFNDFLKALLAVESKYTIWPYGRSNKQMCERVFAYELYHQYRKRMTSYEYNNLILNGEIRKDKSIIRSAEFKVSYPDLVLHEQQNNINQQLIACEIKTINGLNYDSLLKDINKLDKYVESLNFKYSVFVQVLDHEDYFNNSILKILKKNIKSFKHPTNIFYIIKTKVNIKILKLSDLN